MTLSRPIVLRVLGFAAAVLLVGLNFLYFSAASLHCTFASDEMMNLHGAWEAGARATVTHIFLFFKPFYRPTGTLYYWVLYQLFHLDPLPYRVLNLLHMLLNLWLAYVLARSVSSSRKSAFLSVLLFSYHEHVSFWVAYSGAYAYDRLCFTFYAALLAVYFRMRTGASESNGLRCAAVAALFLLAMGSKEMAISAPLLILAFEATHRRTLRPLSRTVLALIAVLLLASILYAYGKTQGPGALAAVPGYQLKPFTAANYFESQARHLQDYLFLQAPPAPGGVIVLFSAMLLAALLAHSPALAFAFAFVVLSPLAIVFTDRGSGALYIPLFGWCLFAGEALDSAVSWISRAFRESWRSRLAHAVFSLAAAALFLWLFTENRRYWLFDQPAILRSSDTTWGVIQDLNRLRPDIRPGARLYVAKNPFDDWDMVFILALWSDVKPLDVWIAGKNVHDATALNGVTGIISFDSAGHLTYRPHSGPMP